MSIPGLSEWLETPLGRYVLAWEQAKCDQAVSDVFGFNAVQFGFRQADLLRANRMPYRFLCDEVIHAAPVAARVDMHQLPFSSASVDLVVLPHVLEFSPYAHQVLREVERILVPEGQVVITGFNPLSLWGIRRHFPSGDARFPWAGEYLGVRRLTDWLKLLGFEVQGGNFGCYVPAVNRENWIARCRWMDKAGDRWWPIFGGAYLLQAVKRVHSMRLIMPTWRDRLARAKSLAPAVQKTDDGFSA